MRYVKDRKNYLAEAKDTIKDDALHILATHDDNQDAGLKHALDELDAETAQKVVVRAAPSPTGMAHIGNIRTMIFNYLFAKKHNGIFYVRIEDTDQKRFVPGAEDYIKNALDWLGITPDWSPWNPDSPNGPYRQSERDYSGHIKTLIDNGNAYYAFDTEKDLTDARTNTANFMYGHATRMSMKNSLSLPKEEVDALLESKAPFVIRFKVPENVNISFDDIIRGNITTNSNQIDDKVLVKSNGIPTYHMANVCDDHDMGTTHVIRGEEWIPSTGLHVLLYQAFGWEVPKFAHCPLLLNPDGKGKLSKRKALQYGFPVFPFGGEAEDDKGQMTKYVGFKDQGYDPDALLNFLVLLGWSPGDDKEIMSMADMISTFSLDKVSKSGARFDIEKAKWFNQSYLKTRDNSDLLSGIDKSGTSYEYNEEELNQIMDMAKKRATFTHELTTTTDIFFKPIDFSKVNIPTVAPEVKEVFAEFVNTNPSWDEESIKQDIFDICATKGIKMGKIMPTLRFAITGGIPGPELPITMEILGREETMKRINGLLQKLG